jgi:hypothetical protein
VPHKRVTGVASDGRWWPHWVGRAVTASFVATWSAIIVLFVRQELPVELIVVLGAWAGVSAITLLGYLMAQEETRESALSFFVHFTRIPRRRLIVGLLAFMAGWAVLMFYMGGPAGQALEIEGQYYRQLRANLIPISADEYRSMIRHDQHIWAGMILALNGVAYLSWSAVEPLVSRRATTPEWLREKLEAP